MRAAAARRAQAFRPGTQANHHSHVVLYTAFARFFNFRDFPAGASTLLAFAEFLLRTWAAHKSVTNALSSVRGFHLRLGLDTSAFDSHDLFLFRRALPLTVRPQVHRAPPFTLALLESLCERASRQGQAGRVFVALMATLFFSMARLSSLAPPKAFPFDPTRFPTRGDLLRDGTGYRLWLKWGKSCQDATQGFWVPILPCGSSTACPVAALRALPPVGPGAPPLSPLFALPSSDGLQRTESCCLTAPVARRWLKTLLIAVGAGGRGYTFHSFRRGASTLAFERGAALTDISSLGGWRSSAVSLYVPHAAARLRAARTLVSPLHVSPE